MKASRTSTLAFSFLGLALVLGISSISVRTDAQQQEGGPDLGAMLVGGLLASEGCLGADTGQMTSGQNVIVAWFENKAAVVRWYNSGIHQSVMSGMTNSVENYSHTPLAHVHDEETPIMVIATITPSNGNDTIKGFPAPISQIAIELFAPLPGGAYINGRFSPDEFEVEHMNNLVAQQ